MNKFNPDLLKLQKEKDPQKLLNSLSPDERAKIDSILSDKEALNNILNSPKAQAILKMLSKNSNNG